jgi:hypothetical protein
MPTIFQTRIPIYSSGLHVAYIKAKAGMLKTAVAPPPLI